MRREIGSREQLRQLRLLAGYSFRELERQTGVSGTWICQHERGRYTLPARHQETIFAFLLQAVRERAAAVDQVLARIDDPVLVEVGGRGS
jgi:transcriptional regulator with XRE-family HTH domain